MTPLAYTIVSLLFASVFVNAVAIAVIIDNEEYIEQQDVAVQYLGKQVNNNEFAWTTLYDYQEANRVLIEECEPKQINRAVKNTPLPELVML